MAGETGPGQVIPDKAVSAAGMGYMAAGTVAAGNGFMDYTPGKGLLSPVAGIAERVLSFAQQASVARHVGIMADTAPGAGHRFMDDPAGEP